MLLRSSYDKLYRNNWRRDPVSGDNSNKQIFILHIFRGNKQIDYRQARQLSNLLVFWQGRKSACYPSVTIFRRQYINLSLENSHKRKMRARLSSTKGCISFFHTYICFARIVLLVQGTILSSRQIVTCKHFPLTTFSFNNNLSFQGVLQWASTIAHFHSNTQC